MIYLLKIAIVLPFLENFALPGKCLYFKFFWSVFSCIWTEYGDLICKFPFLVRIRENKGQKNFEHEHFLYSGEETGEPGRRRVSPKMSSFSTHEERASFSQIIGDVILYT